MDPVRGEALGEDPRAARALAVVAGAFLVLRGTFGRGRGQLLSLVAGVLVLVRAFSRRQRSGRRREPEVVEVKSPAELEPGIASASPRPTFSSRVDRPHDPRG